MNVRLYLITDSFVSLVDTRIRLSTETLLKGMQLELYYKCLGKARHQIVGGPRHFCQDYLNTK